MKFRDRHNGVFAGFAPSKDPVIAVAVIAEHACSGSMGAAPIGRQVIKTYLEKYYPELYSEKVLAARLKDKGQTLQVPKIKAAAANDEGIVANEDDTRSVTLPTTTDAPPAPPEVPAQ